MGCVGCTKRWIDVEKGTRCHSTCETYLKQKGEREHVKTMRAQALKKEDDANQFKIDQCRKEKRRRNK